MVDFAGLHDKGVESEFEWSDGTAVQYTNWDAWQPDDWRNYEDCGHVKQYGQGRWNDLHCGSSLPYICKRPKGLLFNQHVYFKETMSQGFS